MVYDIRRRIAKQWETHMVEEEAEVWVALKKAGYMYISFDSGPDAPTIRDFTPTVELYMEYTRYRSQKGKLREEDLSIPQFGVAFNAVTENTLNRVKRSISRGGQRVRVWGYVGVRGPRSQETRCRAGRPKNG